MLKGAVRHKGIDERAAERLDALGADFEPAGELHARHAQGVVYGSNFWRHAEPLGWLEPSSRSSNRWRSRVLMSFFIFQPDFV
ncbi:hypothetical protein CQ10_38320 [Bradyrhizobium valentinum]|nr:hypothetical protein CQ10_38320 [Bradyrhizobium valentinum]